VSTCNFKISAGSDVTSGEEADGGEVEKRCGRTKAERKNKERRAGIKCSSGVKGGFY